MRHAHRGALRDQVNFLRRQFLQDGDLPFTDVLTEGVIERALSTLTGWLDRAFSPLVPLWLLFGRGLCPPSSPGRSSAPPPRRDRPLPPGPPAPARVVLRRRGLCRRPRPGRKGRPALA